MDGNWNQSNNAEPDNNYLYNGKELDQDFGLDWYHYGARMYDTAIGIFTGVDPLADEFTPISPYVYTFNNPIKLIDPDGQAPAPPGDYYDEKGNHLGNDGINDNKVFLTTQGNFNSFMNGNSGVKQAIGLQATSTHIGTKNDFGLIQLTGMGNSNITNQGNEDSYSYNDSKGNKVAKGKHGDDWVTPETGAAFYGAIEDYKASTGDTKVEIGVGDASAYNPSFNLGHKTHFTGESIDMRFISTRKGGSNNISNLSTSDLNRNNNFVRNLIKMGFTKNISHQGTIKGTYNVKGHHNHLHTAR